jgi:tRNA 2-thiouridine synthesizing protein B
VSTLHIVSSSPFTSNALDHAFEYASNTDAILLIENAIYAASNVDSNVNRLLSALPGVRFFVLQDDVSARGVLTPLQDFKTVSYAEFVALVCQYHNSVSWG